MNRSVRVFALILVLSTLFAPAFCREINAAEGLVVDHVYYSKLSRFDTGTVHTFIKNTGDHPVEIKSITLNGTPLPSDSRDSRLAYWYEVTPNPIAPGSISDCLIKLSSVPPSLIKLEFNTNTGQTLSRIIRPKDNPLRITFIGFNDSLDKIYVYLENRARKPLSLSGIFLNGADVTSSAHIYCSKLSSMQKDLVTISLSASLVPGERVNLKIGTKEGVTAQETVKAFSYFPITGESGRRQNLALNSNSQIEYSAQVPNPHSAAPLLDMCAYCVSVCPAHRHGTLNNASAVLLDNKRSCSDNNSYNLTYTYICRYKKEESYFIFGQTADIILINPSNLASDYFKPKTDNQQVCQWLTALAKTACQPRPLHTVILAGQSIGLFSRRFPSPAEERLLVYYAVSRGAKGILYRISGLSGKSDLIEEVRTINSELAQLKPYLRISEPIALAQTDDKQIEPATLLAGDEAIILILLNHDITQNYSAKGVFSYNRKQNIKVRLKIPGHLTPGILYEITGKIKKIVEYEQEKNATNRSNSVILNIDKLDITRQYLLLLTQAKKQKGGA